MSQHLQHDNLPKVPLIFYEKEMSIFVKANQESPCKLSVKIYKYRNIKSVETQNLTTWWLFLVSALVQDCSLYLDCWNST